MDFALTTRWNAAQHIHGEDLVDEILELGFSQIELGYDLRPDHVPGVKKKIADGSVRVTSVHNYCPVPMGAPSGHPELFTLAHPDRKIREAAVSQTVKTIHFAQETGAACVVVHAGNTNMKKISPRLFVLHEQGKRYSNEYERLLMQLQTKRQKKVRRQLDHLTAGLERLLPVLESSNMILALENLPTWEAIPTELELEQLLRRFNSPHIRYWHDFGHGQVRENIGLINHRRWLERLQPYLAGFHLHDVKTPAADHLMPPMGDIVFNDFKELVVKTDIRVFEPAPAISAKAIREGLDIIRQVVSGKWPATSD